MSKKYNRVKLKKSAIVTIVAIVAVVVALILVIVFSETDTFAQEYNLTSGDHVFTELSYSEFKEEIKGEDIIYVYYGKADDSNCLTNVTVINDTAKIYDIEKIYYLDANDMSSEQVSEFMELGLKNRYPQVIKFKNGAVVDTTYAYQKLEPARGYDWYITKLFTLA